MIERLKAKPVLVVEDSPEDFEVLARAFRKAGILLQLQQAFDGEDAIDYLESRGKYAQTSSDPMHAPALILMDLNLPGNDGIATIETIKKNPKISGIPLVVLTTSRSDTDVNATYAAGANSFIPKPADLAGYVRLAQMLKSYWFECAILP